MGFMPTTPQPNRPRCPCDELPFPIPAKITRWSEWTHGGGEIAHSMCGRITGDMPCPQCSPLRGESGLFPGALLGLLTERDGDAGTGNCREGLQRMKGSPIGGHDPAAIRIHLHQRS